jgi:hypothetical protein
VIDLEAVVARLREAGGPFCGHIATGVGGKQLFVNDAPENPVALFESATVEARLGRADAETDR